MPAAGAPSPHSATVRRPAYIRATGCTEVRRGNRLTCMALVGARDCVGAEYPSDGDRPRFLAHGPGLSPNEIDTPAGAMLLPPQGDYPHTPSAHPLAEFCLHPEPPGRLQLADREPRSAGYLALLLQCTAEPAPERAQ